MATTKNCIFHADNNKDFCGHHFLRFKIMPFFVADTIFSGSVAKWKMKPTGRNVQFGVTTHCQKKNNVVCDDKKGRPQKTLCILPTKVPCLLWSSLFTVANDTVFVGGQHFFFMAVHDCRGKRR